MFYLVSGNSCRQLLRGPQIPSLSVETRDDTLFLLKSLEHRSIGRCVGLSECLSRETSYAPVWANSSRRCSSVWARAGPIRLGWRSFTNRCRQSSDVLRCFRATVNSTGRRFTIDSCGRARNPVFQKNRVSHRPRMLAASPPSRIMPA